MIDISKLWGWISWPTVRAHLCTLAVSLTWNATWRVPREGFRYGGLVYGLVLTAALLVVAPLTLLQLSVGQLSQQDAVGIWRAVPFFRGVGYMRLLISFLGAAYSMIYLSLAVAYFLYTATHDIPFPDCIELVEIEEQYVNVVNASDCLRLTFMSPVTESPEYFLAITLIAVVLWITSSFVFYTSVKLMKRIMYLLPPLLVILGVVIPSCIGDSSGLTLLVASEDWRSFTQPYMLVSAVVQALWSSQIAGGFLIVAGDSVYSNTNVQWSAVAITVANVVSSWFWLLFWYSVSGADKDTTVVAVLVQVYQTADGTLELVWPILLYLTLILSGVITMLVFLYPVYDRVRRLGGTKWRLASFAISVAGAGVSLALLAGSLPVLRLVEDLAVPLLICLASLIEILALGFIYGWRNLIEDVEFLIGNDLNKGWVWGWWLAPAVITPAATWWLTDLFVTHPGESWAEVEEASAALVTVVVASIILVVCATVAVARQVQYDILEKLKSSFRPSRHWGPRDPITHYYWLARREDIDRGYRPRTRYNRRELGQLSHRISFLTSSESTHSKTNLNDTKQRSNSDDWLYTTGRKINLNREERKRSKSLDWDLPRKTIRDLEREDNNNIVGFNYTVMK